MEQGGNLKKSFEVRSHIAIKNDQFAFRIVEAIGGVYDEWRSKDKEFVMNFTGKNKYFSKGFSKSSHKKDL